MKYKFVPLVILGLGLLVYAPVIPWMGMYWDDWPSLWFLHFGGPSIFPQVFTVDRPFLGWLFIITTSVIGESMTGWQIFGVLTWVLNTLVFGWMLNTLWPGRRLQVLAMMLLFLVTPGFKHQYIAITYSHIYLVMSIFLLSFGTMVAAYRGASRGSRWFWMLYITSLGLSALCMFTSEYFVGLELLRPALIWLSLEGISKTLKDRLRRVAFGWLPYLSFFAAFLIFRLNTPTPRGEITILTELSANPLSTLINLVKEVVQDVLEASLISWAKTFNLSILSGAKWFIIAFTGLILVAAALLTILLLLKIKPGDQSGENLTQPVRRRWSLQAIALGAYAMLVCGIPIWATNLKISLNFPFDRFMLLMMPGASILLVGMIELVTWKRAQKAILVGVLVGFAASSHFLNAVSYRAEWTNQRDFFWQLAWRIPGYGPGTMLLTTNLPFTYVTDNSLTAPLNWIYFPENESLEMPTMMVDAAVRLGSRSLADLEPGTPYVMSYRLPVFSGNTDQALVFYYEPGRCLKVFDPTLDADWPHKPQLLHDAIPLSDLGLIQPDASTDQKTLEALFGPEPAPDWCYYVNKAELARQQGDWQEIGRLADLAGPLDQDLSKNSAAELAPFIIGSIHLGDWETALALSMRANQLSPKVHQLICAIWQTTIADTQVSPERQRAVDRLEQELGCKFQ